MPYVSPPPPNRKSALIVKAINSSILDKDGNIKQVIQLPFNSKILCVKNMGGSLYVYYISTECERMEDRTFYIFKTGQVLPDRIHNINYIDTVLFDAGNYVVHVFEGELV